MSSKILPGDDGHPMSRPEWRLVGAAAPDPAKKPVPPEVDYAAQIAQLQQQCERRVAEARAAGVREGETTGRNRAAAELQPAIERLARSIEAMSQFRPQLRREAEADMVRLSLAIARRILRRELSIDPDAMHGLVLGALEKLQMQEIVRIKVHPAHLAAVTACLRPNAAANRVELVADASREPGGILFETARGDLDASVDCQLQEIERGLTDCLARRS